MTELIDPVLRVVWGIFGCFMSDLQVDMSFYFECIVNGHLTDGRVGG